MIREVCVRDAQEIVDIYNYYIENTNITFEESILSAEDMKQRIEEKLEHNNPWIVYEENGKVIGYAYLGTWRDRSAYRFSKESSVYVKEDMKGNGIGTLLYKELIKLAKERGIHAIIASITCPNELSFKLHEKLGFEKMAEYKVVGYKNDTLLDVAFYELLI